MRNYPTTNHRSRHYTDHCIKICKYLFFCIKLTFTKGRCIHTAMVILRQHSILIMLVATALFFSMSASHCSWTAQILDNPTSSALLLSHNEFGEEDQEDSHASAYSFLPQDILATYATTFHPVLLSIKLTPVDQCLHLPQIYFDIFVPPQKFS